MIRGGVIQYVSSFLTEGLTLLTVGINGHVTGILGGGPYPKF